MFQTDGIQEYFTVCRMIGVGWKISTDDDKVYKKAVKHFHTLRRRGLLPQVANCIVRVYLKKNFLGFRTIDRIEVTA